jgi:TetR/AcrR family transcriptional repressor of nem operon
MGRTSSARRRLLHAAFESFASRSYNGTTIDDICARAQVRKGSFYYFFRSKSELAVAAVRAAWEQRRAHFDGFLDATTEPLLSWDRFAREEHRRQVEWFSAHGRALGCPFLALASEIGPLQSELGRALDEALLERAQYWRSSVEEVHRAGHRSDIAVDHLVRIAIGFAQGTLVEARIRNDPAPILELAGAIRALFGAATPTRVTRQPTFDYQIVD